MIKNVEMKCIVKKTNNNKYILKTVKCSQRDYEDLRDNIRIKGGLPWNLYYTSTDGMQIIGDQVKAIKSIKR